MGSVETLAHKGTGVVCQAVKKIVGDCSGEPVAQPCILEVSDQGLRMVDRSKSEVRSIPDRQRSAKTSILTHNDNFCNHIDD